MQGNRLLRLSLTICAVLLFATLPLVSQDKLLTGYYIEIDVSEGNPRYHFYWLAQLIHIVQPFGPETKSYIIKTGGNEFLIGDQKSATVSNQEWDKIFKTELIKIPEPSH